MLRSLHLEEVSHETVGQFVELTDRNKREVYEGDILKWKEYDFEKIGVVIWSSTGVFIGRPREHGIQCIGVASTIKETEIIGNIHDNPELLKESRMDNDLERIISEMSKVDIRSETDKMMERIRLGGIRYSKLSEVSVEHTKNDSFMNIADCFALPVLPESRTIIHIGMDFAKQETPLSKWQRFKSFFKRKCKK